MGDLSISEKFTIAGLFEDTRGVGRGEESDRQ
jgi:hypothetical protein